jgi:hypothetical protein
VKTLGNACWRSPDHTVLGGDIFTRMAQLGCSMWLEMSDTRVRVKTRSFPVSIHYFMCMLAMLFIFSDKTNSNLVSRPMKKLLLFQVRNKSLDDSSCLCIHFQVFGMVANKYTVNRSIMSRYCEKLFHSAR